jgi:hypothetical protein
LYQQSQKQGDAASGLKNEGSRPMSIKLNGIGNSAINNNSHASQLGSSKSDGKSNNDESHPDDNSPGITSKIKK